MVINDTEKLACTTNVHALESNSVTLEPLHGFRCLGDLVVDMAGFFNNLDDEWSYLTPIEDSKNRDDQSVRFEKCVECGCCVSACPVSRDNLQFLGPAALSAINREIKKSPGRKHELLTTAGSDHGESSCRRALMCSRVCPTAVFPAMHIAELRKAVRGRSN